MEDSTSPYKINPYSQQSQVWKLRSLEYGSLCFWVSYNIGHGQDPALQEQQKAYLRGSEG